MDQNRKKKGNYPNLRFPEFDGEWEEKRLGEVSTIVNEKISTSTLIHSNYISTENIEQDFQNAISKASSIPLNINVTSFQVHDILLSNIRPYLKKTWFADIDGGCSADVFVFRTKDICHSSFLYYIIANESFVNYVMNGAKGVKMPRGDKQQIIQYPIFLPSLQEQDKITSLLTLIDQRIETQRKIIEGYESLIKWLSEGLFFHKLRFENFERSWDTKSGEEIFENISDKNHDSSYPILAITQQYGAIPRDLIDYNVTVTDKSIENYKAVQIGDFIISLRSFQGGIEYSNYLGICSPAYIVLRSIIPINRIFYKYYLKTSRYIAELNKNLEGIRDGKMISYKQFSEISLPYPAITEQNKIANTLATVDSKLELERLLVEKHSEQKQYLLKELFI